MTVSNITNQGRSPAMPVWAWIAAGLGLLWNLYGVYQYIGSFSATAERLMAAGMTQAQADIYLQLPVWISVAFGVGVFGGLLGTVLLLMRNKLATPILLVSLVGYAVLFAGDLVHGVFANIPSQLAILAFVVAVAVALLWLSRRVDALGRPH
jgi:hypothetical protein